MTRALTKIDISTFSFPLCSFVIFCCFFAFCQTATAQLTNVGLTVDTVNSNQTGAFGGSLEATISDLFVYNPQTPVATLPDLFFNPAGNPGQPGWHALGTNNVDVVLYYDLAGGPLLPDTFVVDLYGRDSFTQRDDNIDIVLKSGGFNGTIVTSQLGLAIADQSPQHARATFSSISGAFDTIELVAHDSSDSFNYFTLMEIRAAASVPEPGSIAIVACSCLGLAMRRRRI